jgi:hypothetical protein
MRKWIATCLGGVALAAMIASVDNAQVNKVQGVDIIRVPDGGLQPQAAIDNKGVLHLIYFKGEPGHGDLFYVTSKDAGQTFSPPIRVNNEPGTAVAAGTIRGGKIALGKGGRVYVGWNGSSKSSLRGRRIPNMAKDSPYNGLPMLFARLNDAGTKFEDARNVMKLTFGLDGGGDVAADLAGHVYVAWHGKTNGDAENEDGRAAWIACSSDAGRYFTPEHKAWSEPTGACGCCSLSVFAGKDGTVYILYRSAKQTVNRDMYLLESKDEGKTFTGKRIDKWNIGACPMTSMAFAEGDGFLDAAWQTKEQVYFAKINPGTFEISQPIAAPDTGKLRKYPTLAINRNGDTLFAWTEGTGWGSGGSLEWQVFDKNGTPTGEKGSVSDLPAWSFGAAFVRPDESFAMLY